MVSPDLIRSLVGKVVKVKIGEADEAQGDLYSYDAASHTLALNVPTESGSNLKHWVLVPGQHVHSIGAVEDAKTANVEGDDEMDLTMESARKREKKSLDKALEDARHVNTSVDNQTQNIYNALRKTMPCEWSGNDIVVMGLVTIRGPRYVADTCEGADESSLSRVRKVVRARPRAVPRRASAAANAPG
jgi:hypothetical protein